MSYDISLHVKAGGCTAYPVIAEPECSGPTYNFGKWGCNEYEAD